MVDKPVIDWDTVEEDKLKSQLLDEVNDLIAVPIKHLQRGDLSITDISEGEGIGRTAAKRMMKQLAKDYPDIYDFMKVLSDGCWMNVLRRKR